MTSQPLPITGTKITTKVLRQKHAVQTQLEKIVRYHQQDEKKPFTYPSNTVETDNRDDLKDLYDRGVLSRKDWGSSFSYQLPERRDGMFGQSFMTWCEWVGIIDLAEQVQAYKANQVTERAILVVDREIENLRKQFESQMAELEARKAKLEGLKVEVK